MIARCARAVRLCPVRRGAARRCAAAILVAAATSCGVGGRPEEQHIDLAAFASAGGPAAARRVVLIGIDGASWDYLDPLLAADRLPALARLRREGATARLRSIDCHFTPPAWTTMLTGVLPARHGIYGFGSWDREQHRFEPVRSSDVHAPAVWDVASSAGRRVSVIGLPTSYPSYPVNGVMVSGLMTPKTRLAPLALHSTDTPRPPVGPPLVSYAPLLTAAFEDAENLVFPTFLDTKDDGRTGYAEVQVMVAPRGADPARAPAFYRYPIGAFSPWIRVGLGAGAPESFGFAKIRFDPPGAAGVHYLLTPTFLRIRTPWTWPPELAADLEQRFGYYLPHEFLSIDVLESVTREAAAHARYFFERGDWDLYLYLFGQSDNAHHLVGFGKQAFPVYRVIDRFVGRVLDAASPDTTVVVASDHGFGALDRSVDLNQFLAGLGLLAWKREGVIDHERTLVFHNMWHLYFNRALLSEVGLRQRGIEPQPGEAPADALARHLAAAARELRGASGEVVSVELVRVPADAAGAAPDMAVRPHPDAWIEFWNVDRPQREVVHALSGDERWKHVRDGILAVWGPGIAQGRDLGTVDIADVAPTILDLLGLPVADDFDGKVAAVLDAAAARARTLHRVLSYAKLARETAPAPEDLSTFEETLRALGYVRD
jgi:predicted AlkP superfamily phosphohydrolase/phosphomutase